MDAMRHVTVADIQLFGGDPVLDFTNTLDSRGTAPGPDVLGGFHDLTAWALRRGVVGAAEAAWLAGVPQPLGRRALARAKALREALYRILSAPPTAMDLALVDRAIQAAQRARSLVHGPGGYAWRWRENDADTVGHRIALAAATLLTAPTLARVHVCPGENCGWLFLDTSRSGRRLWCSEATCGRRARIRRWRARQRGG